MFVVVECEKGSRDRFEKLFVDGELVFKQKVKRPYLAAYGYVKDTLQEDGDEMDAYIIGGKVRRGSTYNVRPICLIKVTDDGACDDKLVCTVDGIKGVERYIPRIAKAIAKYSRTSKVNGIVLDPLEIHYAIEKCRQRRAIAWAYSKK